MSQSNDEFNEELASGHCPVLEKTSRWGRRASDNLRQRIEEKKAKLPDNKVSLTDLLTRLKAQVQGLIRDEIALAKSQIKSLLAQVIVGAACLIVAGILALFMLGWLLNSLFEVFVVLGLPAWGSAMLVVGVLLLLVLVFSGFGVMFLKKGLSNPPTPAKEVKADVEAVKKGMK